MGEQIQTQTAERHNSYGWIKPNADACSICGKKEFATPVDGICGLGKSAPNQVPVFCPHQIPNGCKLLIMAKELTRREVAELLGISSSRVSQLAKEIDATNVRDMTTGERRYFMSDVRKMQKRNVKSGPRPQSLK